MSDGPHRSLGMRRGWKRYAECADNEVYSPEEVRDALPRALEQDWRAEVSESLCRQVGTILRDSQDSLFGDSRVERLEALRSEVAGYPLAGVLLDCAIESAAKGKRGDEALKSAAREALADRAVRGARDVEEHYRRESTDKRAAHVRERVEQGIADSDIGAIAGRLVGTDTSEQPPSQPKRTGLDDGVQLK